MGDVAVAEVVVVVVVESVVLLMEARAVLLVVTSIAVLVVASAVALVVVVIAEFFEYPVELLIGLPLLFALEADSTGLFWLHNTQIFAGGRSDNS